MLRQRLIIADDHELFAAGLCSLLAPHHEVLCLAGTADALLRFLAKQSVDCALLDLSLPDRSGLDVLPDLKTRYPNSRVIVLTMYADRLLASECCRLGADAFIPKSASLAELLAATPA